MRISFISCFFILYYHYITDCDKSKILDNLNESPWAAQAGVKVRDGGINANKLH